MRTRLILVLGVVSALSGCGPRDEFEHQTVEAYQADNGMRQQILQRCADHITSKKPFKTESDTDECRKAVTADQNVRLTEHEARERAASNAALSAAAKQFEGK